MANVAHVFLVILVASTVAEAQCYVDGSPGLPLDNYTDPETGELGCREGFVCPGLDPNNASTFPVYCPPSPECYLDRMWAKACDPQGPFEPYLCPRRSYCPNSSTVIPCPEGYYCPGGARFAHKCSALSFCPFRSLTEQYYGSILLTAALTSIYIILYILYRCFCLTTTMYESTEDPTETPSSSTKREAWENALIEGFRRARGNSKPLHFTFNGLGVCVRRSDGTTKVLLENVTGKMRPGTVTAILGPSGCGKSVFLSTLLTRTPSEWKLTGNLTVNGSPDFWRFKHAIGYVPQEDIIHRDLSLAQNLHYSSEIRLLGSFTAEQRHRFVSAVISCLEMGPHRDLPIGDEEEGGLSGGQRKRSSIAVELVAAPMALFLDAPTSGLDAFTALDLCILLKKIARQTDLTIGMIMQQPRIEIWEALDEVLFMGPNGRTVYQGTQSAAQDYFVNQCGLTFSSECNPADVIVDEISQRGRELTCIWEEYVAAERSPSATSPAQQSAPTDATAANGSSTLPYGESDLAVSGASFLRQVVLCHNRSIEKQVARISSLLFEFCLVAASGIILGISMEEFIHFGVWVEPYARLSPLPWRKILPEVHMYAFAAVGLASAVSGTRIFSLDHRNRMREVGNGHSLLADFIGTVLSTIYRVALCSLVYASTYHFSAALNVPFYRFWFVFLVVYWATYALSFLVASVSDVRISATIALVVSFAISVMNGRIDFPVFIQYLSYTFWASQIAHCYHYERFAGVHQETLSETGYEEGREALSFVIILLYACIFQGLAFLFFTRRYHRSQI